MDAIFVVSLMAKMSFKRVVLLFLIALLFISATLAKKEGDDEKESPHPKSVKDKDDTETPSSKNDDKPSKKDDKPSKNDDKPSE